MGNLIAEDVIPAPREARDSLRGIKLGARLVAAKLGDIVDFDIEAALNSVHSPGSQLELRGKGGCVKVRVRVS